MTFKMLIAALAVALAASPALAKKPRHRVENKVQAGCVDNWPRRSLSEILFSFGPEPQANGCAPAIYSGGRFVGQDPDPRIRQELLRNPDVEGYHQARP